MRELEGLADEGLVIAHVSWNLAIDNEIRIHIRTGQPWNRSTGLDSGLFNRSLNRLKSIRS